MDQEAEEGKDKTSPDKQEKSPQVLSMRHAWSGQHTLGSSFGVLRLEGSQGWGVPLTSRSLDLSH